MLPNASQLLSLFTSAACFTSSSTPAAELQMPSNGCPSRFVAFGSEPQLLFDMLFMIPSDAPYRILIAACSLAHSSWIRDFIWCYSLFYRVSQPRSFFLIHFSVRCEVPAMRPSFPCHRWKYCGLLPGATESNPRWNLLSTKATRRYMSYVECLYILCCLCFFFFGSLLCPKALNAHH